ncbi:siderophore-interacting protein [Bosea sp. NBC_00550]|uniref:siderophore-interacting protein n=1 Tax=Bosea sp. NBC_00550 TaxID=2969621 RepID=UPI00222F1D73|nr:siderophore-interacting protein [Bosea sp. NBC_00550]UZF91764.1 siderophore-interacting protein [Bosea sp. NBC_00550]
MTAAVKPISSPTTLRFAAKAVIAFPRVSAFLPDILDSIATHDMEVMPDRGGYTVSSPLGVATVAAGRGTLTLTVGTDEPTHLNRLKHALAGPIEFIARSEQLVIDWQGDATGPSLPDDLRILRVRQIEDMSPRLRRIVFSGENLVRFDRPDQIHCRLLFQPEGIDDPQWPMLGNDGKIIWPESGPLPSRVYTIREIDAAAGTITIDFSLHPTPGPATRWAIEARPGSMAGILGPAAKGPKPAEWYMLAGDETGLPGIARILADLHAQARGIALVEVGGAEDEQQLRHPPGIALRWLHRAEAAPGLSTVLVDAVRASAWPDDLASAFFWGGCEFQAFRAIHRHLREEVGLPADRRVLYSHWHRSMSEEDIIAVGSEAYLP